MRNYLKSLRENNGLSQQNVENITGIKQQYYSLIETGERQQDMSLSVMEKLSSALNVPLDEFIKMEQEYKENSH